MWNQQCGAVEHCTASTVRTFLGQGENETLIDLISARILGAELPALALYNVHALRPLQLLHAGRESDFVDLRLTGGCGNGQFMLGLSGRQVDLGAAVPRAE